MMIFLTKFKKKKLGDPKKSPSIKTDRMGLSKETKKKVEEQMMKNIIKDDVWDSNDIDSVDRKINQSANDNLDALENTLDHLDEIDAETFSDLQDTAKEMVDDCSYEEKDELKKVLHILIKVARKSCEEE